MLPNLALWDQGAPPLAARGPVALATVPRPARHTGLPLRSRPGAGRAASPRPAGRRQRRRAPTTEQLGDEHQAVTIADMVDLLKLGTAIDARRRSAPTATGGWSHHAYTLRAAPIGTTIRLQSNKALSRP